MKVLLLFALLCAFTATRATEENHLEKRLFWSCPNDWTKYKGRCFRYIPRKLSWANSEKNCQSMRGHLASVKDKDEYKWIQDMINNKGHGLPQTWLGGSTQTDNEWFWSDGKGYNFTHWCNGEPNNRRSQRCLQMNFSSKKCWDNLQCYFRLPSVCVHDPSFWG